MKKYVLRKLSEYPNIGYLGKVYSAIFSENGYSSMKDISKNFPDFKAPKGWLIKFLQNELEPLKGTIEFSEFVATNRKKHFCIIGDYDADGLMATTILKLTFDKIGILADFIIPDRLNDGYGIKNKHVDKAIELKADIIITVDNGITEPDVVNYAKSKGLLVVITDHHLPEFGNLPKADLVINPHVSKEVFPTICGAFVALKLALSIFDIGTDKENEYFVRDLALFAAVATITDVMPLVRENRLLVKYVLETTNFIRGKNVWSGRTMKFLSGFSDGSMMKDTDKVLTEDTFSYYIGPSLNASGRINGETRQIVEDIVKSADYNTYINGYFAINKERQSRTKMLLKEYTTEDLPIALAILDSNNFEFPIQGLTGLVASKVSDEEQKPAFIGIEYENNISFSCRSPLGYSLHNAFNRLQETGLVEISGGGHDGAMGIKLLDKSQLPILKEMLIEDYRKNAVIAEELVFEFEDNMIDEIFEAHHELAPFGQEFRGLTFTTTGIFEEFLPDTRELVVDGYSFKSYISNDNMPPIGALVRITFKPGIDSKTVNYFKINELEILQENNDINN